MDSSSAATNDFKCPQPSGESVAARDKSDRRRSGIPQEGRTDALPAGVQAGPTPSHSTGVGHQSTAASTGSGLEVPGGHPRRNASAQAPVAPGPSGSKQDGRASSPDQAAAQPHVGEWWRTPDGILWRVDGVSKRTVKLSTSRSYGVMKASAHRAEFVRRSARETVDA